MINFEESIGLVAQLAKPLAAEDVDLDNADGRVLAAPVVSRRDAPAFAVSAMDGYAVREQDILVRPVILPITGKSFAGGGVPNSLNIGTCMRVFTGGAVPDGADRVIMQEDVIAEAGGARFHLPPGNSRHIRAAGSDFARGDVLVPERVPLNPQRLVAVAAADVARVSVIRHPRVCIIACGDELVPSGRGEVAKGTIPDSISIAVAALARRWNSMKVERLLRPDDLDILSRTAAEAIERADVIVVTGGASVGERDFAKAMFVPHGLQLVFDKVAIRPGKPVWLGRAGKAIILGLPGNPTSALVTARLYLAPLLWGLSGLPPEMAWDWQPMTLTTPLAEGGERDTFLRAVAQNDGVAALSNQDSAAQKRLADATFLIWQRRHSRPMNNGEEVEVLKF